MVASRLDLPVLITAEQIRRREFVTIRRGYDPDQVRRYLDQLAEQVDLMAGMIRDTRLEAEAALRANAQPHGDPYERLATRLASVIREADEAAERFRIEGRQEAERLLTEARGDADRMRTDAQAQAEDARLRAERALHEAQAQADRTLVELSTRRQALVGQLSQMQERLLGVARDLEAAIEAPLSGGLGDVPVSTTTPAPHGSTDAADELARLANGEERAAAATRTSVWGGEPSEAPARPAEELFSEAPARAPGGEEPFSAEPVDPSYEEMWEEQSTMSLEVPNIPPLDLSWDDEDDAADPRDEHGSREPGSN